MTIQRRLDALRAAIKKPNAKEMLEIRDRLGHDWLRHRELACRLAHAALLRDRHRDAEMLRHRRWRWFRIVP